MKHSATTADQQKSLTPDAVLADLLEGNQRFVAGQLRDLDIRANIEATSTGQFPKAVILSCLDSRVPVEFVFDQGIGDVFVGRIAGNVETVELLGSFEFATKLAGAKLVLVLGHEACGAVKGACDGAEMGNLTDLLAKIQPAVDAVKGEFPQELQNSGNAEFVESVVTKNVELTVQAIREKSPVLEELEEAGEIKIVGAVYSLSSGKVTLL